MSTLSSQKQQKLELLIKSAVAEAIREERFNLQFALLPTVTNKELKEIEAQFGEPKNYQNSDYEDITNWFGSASQNKP